MRQVTRSAVLLLVMVISLTAWAEEEPKAWQDIGTVSQWMEMDSRFYRLLDEDPNQDVSQFRLIRWRPTRNPKPGMGRYLLNAAWTSSGPWARMNKPVAASGPSRN